MVRGPTCGAILAQVGPVICTDHRRGELRMEPVVSQEIISLLVISCGIAGFAGFFLGWVCTRHPGSQSQCRWDRLVVGRGWSRRAFSSSARDGAPPSPSTTWARARSGQARTPGQTWRGGTIGEVPGADPRQAQRRQSSRATPTGRGPGPLRLHLQSNKEGPYRSAEGPTHLNH